MDRETKEIQIEKHSFLVKTYATAREAHAIQQAYFKGTKVEVVGELPKISEFNPAVQQEVEKELIAQMVLSFDGNAENMVERCLDLPADIYNELVSQLDSLVSKKRDRAGNQLLQHGESRRSHADGGDLPGVRLDV